MQKSSLDIRHDFHQHGMVLLYFVVVVRSSQTTLATPFIPFHNSKSLNCCDLWTTFLKKKRRVLLLLCTSSFKMNALAKVRHWQLPSVCTVPRQPPFLINKSSFIYIMSRVLKMTSHPLKVCLRTKVFHLCFCRFPLWPHFGVFLKFQDGLGMIVEIRAGRSVMFVRQATLLAYWAPRNPLRESWRGVAHRGPFCTSFCRMLCSCTKKINFLLWIKWDV